MSYTVFKTSDLHPLGKLILSVFSLLRLVQVETGMGEDKKSTRVNNFTLINFVIKMLGPLHERTLTSIMLAIQVSEFNDWLMMKYEYMLAHMRGHVPAAIIKSDNSLYVNYVKKKKNRWDENLSLNLSSQIIIVLALSLHVSSYPPMCTNPRVVNLLPFNTEICLVKAKSLKYWPPSRHPPLVNFFKHTLLLLSPSKLQKWQIPLPVTKSKIKSCTK